MAGQILCARVAHGLLALVVAVGVGACSNGAKSGGGRGPRPNIDAQTPAPKSSECTKLRAQIVRIYVQATQPDENLKKQKRRELVRADNVNMVLADCNKHPKRFVPCIKSAVSVSQMERDCLIKLDDEGKVEGDYFKKKP